MSQVALASALLGEGRMKAKMQLAERISRRDSVSQGVLLSVAAAEEDYAAAFAHLDTSLTVRPDTAGPLFKIFVPMLGDPAALRSLARYAGRPWFFDFLSAAVGEGSDPRQVAALWLQARPKLKPDQRWLLPLLLQRLADGGHGAMARRLAVEVRGVEPAGLDDFAFTPATTQPELAPLAWAFSSGEDIDTQFSPRDGLMVEVMPGKRALVMQRFMQLREGRYELRQESGVLEGRPPRLEWHLGCRNGAALKAVWQQAVPLAGESVRYTSVLAIPDDCANQLWQLIALAEDDQTDARFKIGLVSLRPLPGR